MEKTAEFSVKAKGFLDGRFAEQLDAYARQWSPYYNFAFTKEREPYSSFSLSGALHPHEYARLLAATKQKIGVLAQQMLEGQIAAAPYQMNRRSPCSGCEYKPVCKFDWEINSYRFLSSMSKEDVLSALEEAADE
jgi:ATP-dependent helicase/nuclease subunit B